MRSLSPLLVLILSFSAHGESVNPETLTERSQAKAREVLDRVVAASGGAELLRSIDAVLYQHEGESWERLQMQTPLPPFEASTWQSESGSHRRRAWPDWNGQ